MGRLSSSHSRAAGRTWLRAAADVRAARTVFAFWLTSRLLIVAGIASVSPRRLSAVTNWDGAWYRYVATHGYDFAADGRWHSIAFFPLYPYAVSIIMRLGLGYEVAAIAVSNGCYLAMLVVAYRWVAARNGLSAARWTSALLAFYPLSLFGSVAYAEGPFMLLSVLALRDFDGGQYRSSAIWSALASFARPNGVCLAPAFAAAALFERRGGRAFGPACSALLGALAMTVFGAVRFHDPLAFVHAQEAWRHGIGTGISQWQILLASGTLSFGHWMLNLGTLPLVAVLLVRGQKWPFLARLILWSIVIAVERVCWGRDFSFAVIGLLGTAACIGLRRRLGSAVVVYAGVSLIVLLGSGSPMSADRYIFGALAFVLAVGLLMDRAPAFGIPLLAANAVDLVRSAAAFAASDWVA